MKATAVLITKDNEYSKKILNTLPEFDEILIESNCPSVHRRYDLALKAKNDLIYVQDDDCIVDVLALFKEYNGQLTNFISPQHKDFYADLGMTLVGWGTFFPKKMIDFSPYIDKYGIDPLLLSQADRVFTFLNRPFNSIVTEIQHLPWAMDSTRMWTQLDHWSNLQLIKQQCNTLELS